MGWGSGCENRRPRTFVGEAGFMFSGYRHRQGWRSRVRGPCVRGARPARCLPSSRRNGRRARQTERRHNEGSGPGFCSRPDRTLSPFVAAQQFDHHPHRCAMRTGRHERPLCGCLQPFGLTARTLPTGRRHTVLLEAGVVHHPHLRTHHSRRSPGQPRTDRAHRPGRRRPTAATADGPHPGTQLVIPSCAHGRS